MINQNRFIFVIERDNLHQTIMRIFINNEELTIFNGATVLDVLRAYYVKHNKKLPAILPAVYDAYGNSVAHDGELTEGNHLFIKSKEKHL